MAPLQGAFVLAAITLVACSHTLSAEVRVVANVEELQTAFADGVNDIQLLEGVYDLSKLPSSLVVASATRLSGAPNSATVLRGFRARRLPLFDLRDAPALALRDLSFRECGVLVEIASEGPFCQLECRRLRSKGPGPLLLARQTPSDSMRDLAVTVHDCQLDCNHQSKAIHLVGVGIRSFTMSDCHVQNCEKAAVQIGKGDDDLWQPRRRNITVRNCDFTGVLDRDTDPGESHALFLRACQDVLLEDLRIGEINSRTGRTLDTEAIYTKARNVTIRDCQIQNGGRAAITIKGVAFVAGKTDPDHHRCGDDIVITGCQIASTPEHRAVGLTEGVYLDCGGRVAVHNNSIEGVDIGVRIQQRGATGAYMVVDNEMRDLDRGVYYREIDGRVLVAGNRFQDCPQPHTGPAMHKVAVMGHAR